MGTVICTELHRQKLLDDATYEADCRFGAWLPDEVIRGYHRFGIPIANAMKRSRIVTALVAPLARAWAEEMAARVKAGDRNLTQGEGNRFGRFMLKVGVPFCAWLGKEKDERQLAS